MKNEIYWLPCYCRQAQRGGFGRHSVRRYVEEARMHWREVVTQREREHRGWSARRLCRTELIVIAEMRVAALEQEGAICQALNHLEKFAQGGPKQELGRAMAQWGRAEAAHERYLRRRSGLPDRKAC